MERLNFLAIRLSAVAWLVLGSTESAFRLLEKLKFSGPTQVLVGLSVGLFIGFIAWPIIDPLGRREAP